MRRLIAAVVLALSVVMPANNADAHGGHCPQYERMIAAYAPPGGWSVNRMSAIAYRESRCLAHVRSTTRDTGVWQINDVNLPYLSRTLRVPVTQTWLQNPTNNVRAAAALCTYWRRAVGNCYQPWGM